MKVISKKVKNRITYLTIAALALCLGCVFAACTKAQAESNTTPDVSATPLSIGAIGFEEDTLDAGGAEENYSRWLSDHYSAEVYTCAQWLTDLQGVLKLPVSGDTPHAVMSTALENGVIDDASADPYSPLTRRFVAQTLVKALGYEARTADNIADLNENDTALSTAVYYGYFLPDSNGCVSPDALITGEEYQALLAEAGRYERLHGKRALSFGDSIMFGMGNKERGISDMTAEKYGMTVLDFSVSGATFGVCSGHSHIPDQIKTAARINQSKPDIILLNGGTNDMVYAKHGEVVTGYDPKDVNERTFAGGFEYSAYLLQRYWPGVPVVYIRAHDMDVCDDIKEQQFGETELTVAQKWQMDIADIYNDTDFCTEQTAMREAYTAYRAKLGHCDGIHPTALGYAKFYLPLVAERVDMDLSR